MGFSGRKIRSGGLQGPECFLGTLRPSRFPRGDALISSSSFAARSRLYPPSSSTHAAACLRHLPAQRVPERGALLPPGRWVFARFIVTSKTTCPRRFGSSFGVFPEPSPTPQAQEWTCSGLPAAGAYLCSKTSKRAKSTRAAAFHRHLPAQRVPERGALLPTGRLAHARARPTPNKYSPFPSPKPHRSQFNIPHRTHPRQNTSSPNQTQDHSHPNQPHPEQPRPPPPKPSPRRR